MEGGALFPPLSDEDKYHIEKIEEERTSYWDKFFNKWNSEDVSDEEGSGEHCENDDAHTLILDNNKNEWEDKFIALQQDQHLENEASNGSSPSFSSDGSDNDDNYKKDNVDMMNTTLQHFLKHKAQDVEVQSVITSMERKHCCRVEIENMIDFGEHVDHDDGMGRNTDNEDSFNDEFSSDNNDTFIDDERGMKRRGTELNVTPRRYPKDQTRDSRFIRELQQAPSPLYKNNNTSISQNDNFFSLSSSTSNSSTPDSRKQASQSFESDDDELGSDVFYTPISSIRSRFHSLRISSSSNKEFDSPQQRHQNQAVVDLQKTDRSGGVDIKKRLIFSDVGNCPHPTKVLSDEYPFDRKLLHCDSCGTSTNIPSQYRKELTVSVRQGFLCSTCLEIDSGHADCTDEECDDCPNIAQQIETRLRLSLVKAPIPDADMDRRFGATRLRPPSDRISSSYESIPIKRRTVQPPTTPSEDFRKSSGRRRSFVEASTPPPPVSKNRSGHNLLSSAATTGKCFSPISASPRRLIAFKSSRTTHPYALRM